MAAPLPFDGPESSPTPSAGPLPTPPGPAARTPERLTWWAVGLLNAIAAADASDEGEPILAAAGHAATAALLLIEHRAVDDGDATLGRTRLREVYAVSADQVAIVRELLREQLPRTPAAGQVPGQVLKPERTAKRTGGRRRLRLVPLGR